MEAEQEQTEVQRTDAEQKDVERTGDRPTHISKAESQEDQTNTEATKSMVPTQELNIKLTRENQSSMEATIRMVSTAAPQEVINKNASIKSKKTKKIKKTHSC